MNRSVAAIIVSEEGILVARRLEGGEMGGRWEFPGGKVEEGETDEAALVREIDEEFGTVVSPLRLLGESSFVHRGKTRILAAWLGSIPAQARLELREHSEYRWSCLEEIAALHLADSDRSLLEFLQSLGESCPDGGSDTGTPAQEEKDPDSCRVSTR
jgi:8-oxo-dGTP diphosphatase